MFIPDIADVAIIIIFLIPCFVTISIIKKLGIIFLDLSDFELILWSIGFTIIALIPFTILTGLDDFEKIKLNILQPYNIFILITSTLGIGFSIGIILKKLRKGYLLGDPWESIMKQYAKGSSWIIVITSTHQEYMGKFRAAGVATDRRELIMSKPIQIFRNDVGEKIQEMEIGEEVIFTENDITRVFFLDEWKKDN